MSALQVWFIPTPSTTSSISYLYIWCTVGQASSCLRPTLDLKHRALDFGKIYPWQHLVSSHSVTGRSAQSSHWIVWKSWTDELYPSVRTSACSAQRHTKHLLLQHTNRLTLVQRTATAETTICLSWQNCRPLTIQHPLKTVVGWMSAT